MNDKQGSDSTASIRAVNDAFRRTGKDGKVLGSEGVMALGAYFVCRAFEAIRNLDSFTVGNDPKGLHDSGVVEVEGQFVRWTLRPESPSIPGSREKVPTLLICLKDEWSD